MKKTTLLLFIFLVGIFLSSAQSNTLTFTGSVAEDQEFGLGSNQGIYALSTGAVFTQGGTFIQYNQEVISGVDSPVSETFSLITDGSNMNATLTFKYRKAAASTVSGVISIDGQDDFPFDLPDTTAEDGDPNVSNIHKFFDYTVVFPISSTATNVTFTLNEFVKNDATLVRFRLYSIKINGTVPLPPLTSELEDLSGSWGGRFYVRGGEDLDVYVAPEAEGGKAYNYIEGAQEIADSYPTMGHVITNGTNNANSHLWTLRTNPNVDAAMGATGSVVDEEFVPSLANEQIIIDVIDIFKNSGKKVILYVNTQSPANRATEAGAGAWNNYVDTYFGGNGHAAWMNYCEGYVKRFTEIGVDGYWFDSFGSYNINDSLGNADVDSTTEQKAEFVEMIRIAAPNAIITTNIDKDSFVDENGDLILVDTDGIDESVGVGGTGDDPNRDYAIIKMTATNPWSDFTAGHITPLGQGAPPNSWAYEEFTVPDIEESSISIYEENSKQTLKHLFLPIRSTWSSERSELMFDKEQAYRFAKRITDAGGSVTFSNTTSTDGTTSEDEVEILEFLDEQFALNANATVYQRPEGAYLVDDQTLNRWDGDVDSTWTTDANWSKGSAPDDTDNVIIPSSPPNDPIIGAETGAEVNNLTINSSDPLTINSGGSLIVKGFSSGNVRYKRTLATDNWYLVSSPVVEETLQNFIVNNSFATGSGSNIGLAPYVNDGTAWDYQTSESTGTIASGSGYSVKLDSPGDLIFTGTLPVTDIDVSITTNTNGFNLIGNPYPSYLSGNISADDTHNLISVNTSSLTEDTIWLWNQETNSYDTFNLSSSSLFISPAQGFFVSSNGSNTFEFTEAMQSHQSDSFQRSTATRPEISLRLTNGSDTRDTDIFYIEGTTTGWDNGYDSSIFGGATNSFAIYTHLVSESEGQNLGIQSLPDNGFESMIIPVGINAVSGTEITISLATQNLPEGMNVYLEDKEEGSFTLLESDANYTTTLSEALNGIGRYYLHTSAQVLSTDDLMTANISLYMTNNNTLRIVGVQNGTAHIKVYSVLGKQVQATSFQGNGINDVNLPNVAKGVYLTQLETAKGVLSKKIVIK